MSKVKKCDKKWAELESFVKDELEKARSQAMLAETFDEMEEMAADVGRRVQQAL